MRKVYISILLLSILLSCTGCKEQTEPATPVEEQPSVQVQSQGALFASAGYKIRCVITPQNTATLDPLTFEVYVDDRGNGEGLVGYKDSVEDVIISGDKVYVKLDTNTVIYLSDITGHMVPTSINVASMEDLSSNGFTMSGTRVTGYKSNVDGLLYDAMYQSSDTTFESIAISDSNEMQIPNLITTIFNQTLTTPVQDPTPSAGSEEPVRESFYVDSPVGLTIHGKVYSITDYCNPDTYFEQQTPIGIVPEFAFNKDVKVELQHISYMSSDGRTEFMTTDGYVQAIYTTSDFQWLSFYKGMTMDEARALLGIGLKREQLETFQPVLEGLTGEKSKNNNLLLHYGQLTIELVIGNKSRTVDSIVINNYIDFLHV